MTTPVDDLAVGQWIAITDMQEEQPDWSPFAMFRPQPRHVTGQPLKIVAMSLPFLAVTDGMRRFPIDVREVKVKKLEPRYVKAMKASQKDWEPERTTRSAFTVAEPEKPKEKSKGMNGLCPVCESRLIQRKTDGEWFLACRECGFEGTLGKDH